MRLPQCLNLTTSKTKQFARLLYFLNLTTSKTKQFCETSSTFEVTTSKTKQFCETSFKNGKLRAALTASYQRVLWFFHSICVKCCDRWCQVIRSAAPVMQNHLSKFEDLMLQNATPLRTSAPGPPNSSDADISCTASAMRHASLPILLTCSTPAILFWNATKPLRFAHFWEGAQALAPATRNDIWTSKSGPNPGVYSILTLKCASRHNSVHIFDISTTKSGPNLSCL